MTTTQQEQTEVRTVTRRIESFKFKVLALDIATALQGGAA